MPNWLRDAGNKLSFWRIRVAVAVAAAILVSALVMLTVQGLLADKSTRIGVILLAVLVSGLLLSKPWQSHR